MIFSIVHRVCTDTLALLPDAQYQRRCRRDAHAYRLLSGDRRQLATGHCKYCASDRTDPGLALLTGCAFALLAALSSQ